jgi:IclR family acetate operon transcriptional repressor
VREVGAPEIVEGSSQRGVESVARAFDLLEALAEGEAGLVELGRKTGLQPSTTHRLLATLAQLGYVRRNADTRQYALGYRPLALANGVARGSETLIEQVQPFMRSIHRVSGQTTNLFVLQGSDIVYLDQLVSADAEPMTAECGKALPAHATAAGKAIFAFTEPEAVTAILRSAQLERFTEHTIVGPQRLMREFAAIRERGYAVGCEEYANWVTCIAAPILDHASRVVAAFSVSSPTPKLRKVACAAELGELVGATAMQASFALGFPGPSPWHATGAEDSVEPLRALGA